jgi:hypothetical protein
MDLIWWSRQNVLTKLSAHSVAPVVAVIGRGASVTHGVEQQRTGGQKGLCVYCGQRDAVTDDHVPPKSLFGKPRPTLVTVPSCLQCNAGASKDDEYFRTMIAFRHDLDHPDASAAFDAAMRSLARPRGGGIRTALLNGLREVDVRSLAGSTSGALERTT